MEEYDPDLVPTQEFKILHNLVTDPDASAADAVQQVLDLTTTEILSKNDTPGSNFDSDVAWNICVLIIDIAANTAPTRQTKLLDFVSRIRKVTVADPRTGEKVGCGNFGYLWTDLHSFGMHAADMCNSCKGTYRILHYIHICITHLHLLSVIHHHSHTPKELEKWENSTAFIAQSTAAAAITRNGKPTHKMDFSIYGLYACRDAFEEDNQYKSAVRTACLWFIYAAGSMLENCKVGRVYDLHDPPERGFDLDRWHAWKQGLVRTQVGYGDERTQELVRIALERIVQVEAERLN